jgi:hypothetical protein
LPRRNGPSALDLGSIPAQVLTGAVVAGAPIGDAERLQAILELARAIAATRPDWDAARAARDAVPAVPLGIGMPAPSIGESPLAEAEGRLLLAYRATNDRHRRYLLEVAAIVSSPD